MDLERARLSGFGSLMGVEGSISWVGSIMESKGSTKWVWPYYGGRGLSHLGGAQLWSHIGLDFLGLVHLWRERA